MTALRFRATNPDAAAVAATSGWDLVHWGDPARLGAVTIAEENMISALLAERPSPGAILLMDAVRQPSDLVSRLGCPVITMDAPLPGATFLWTPVAARPPGGPLSARSRAAVFPGRIEHYASRARLASALAGVGVTVLARDNHATDAASYAATLRDAAAVVNMAADRKTGNWQMKGRVIEAGMAGCVLLEQRNPVTAQHFVDGEDYLAWESPGELRDLIARVMDGGADAIAANLAEKVRKQFSAVAFWRHVSNEVSPCPISCS